MTRLTFFAVLIATVFAAGTASADPATLAIAAYASYAGISVTAVSATTAFLIRIGVGLAMSALSAALASKDKSAAANGGVRTQSTTAGDQTPQSFILGRYMTAGNLAAPEMSHGIDGDTRYLTRVLDLSDIQCTSLDSIIIDGKQMLLDGATHADYGPTTTFGDYGGFVWCKFYSGSQTSADAMLLSKYGSYPERPWVSDMIGRGVSYAILTFLMPSELDLWTGPPSAQIVVNGIRLYDPRKDTTAGGSGSHRYGTQSTHEWSDNPVVMIYNILRGIVMLGGNTYGGGFTAADLPYATWAAAMNACDVVTGSRKTYIAGYEVKIGTPDVGGDSPLDVIDQLLKACSGEIADVGGTVYIRVGGVALPSYFMTDDDILRSSPQDLDPFPASESSYNGIHATYPSPARLWQAFEAPPRYDDDAIAADGQRLIADIALPAVPQGAQVQQLMKAWLKDEMRRRRHNITLPPEGLLLNPLDVIDWTSDRNGYTGKDFEISQVGIDPRTLSTTLAIREKNPADYDWTVGDEISLTAASIAPVVLGARTVPGWAVTAVSIQDAGGTSRRPALRMAWTSPLPGITSIKWQVRVAATSTGVAQGVTSADDGFQIISAGIIAATDYQVRARLVSRRNTSWTAWTTVTAPSTFLGARDFSGGTIPAVDLSGVLDIAQFATTIRPVEVVGSLPTTGNFEGRMVYLTTDNKLYRHTGSPSGSAGYTVATDGADIVANSITAGQIAAGAIGATEIAADAIIASKIAVSDFTNLVPDADLADAAAWTNGTVFTIFNPTSQTLSRSRGEIRWTTISGTNGISSGLQFPVKAGAEYWWQYQKGRTAAGAQFRGYAQIEWFDKDGTSLSTNAIGSTTEILYATNPVTREGSVTAPTGATSARWRWWVIAADTDSNLRFFAPQFRLKNAGELIVDGAISANKIAANAITAGKIATGAITTGSLIVGGAVSRRVYAVSSASATVTTSVATFATKTGMSGLFEAYSGTAGAVTNPIKMDITLHLKMASFASSFKVTITTEAYISAVWTAVGLHEFDVTADYPSGLRIHIMDVLDNESGNNRPLENATQFRARINKASASGTLTLASGNFYLEQISV